MDKPVEDITRDGQPFFDEPIYAKPKPELISPIAESLAEAFGRVRRRPNRLGLLVRERTDIKTILFRHDRVKLRWLKPDGKGGLKPR